MPATALEQMFRRLCGASSLPGIQKLRDADQPSSLSCEQAFTKYEEVLARMADLVGAAETCARLNAVRAVVRHQEYRQRCQLVHTWRSNTTGQQLTRLRAENDAAKRLCLQQTNDMMRLAKCG
eukprot:TRINITY_DN28622_c0_g2_i1.p1 TRINITY_DN28622_c0_g2~~TRINITY_DN28622_c0_g2_i1.p1  ORF type:complete len:123 (-),score=9.28 TRINITY_DN28622_c0_g2_i1:363-731(-)